MLFHAAGIHWKKTQTANPKRDPELVEKNLKLPPGSQRIALQLNPESERSCVRMSVICFGAMLWAISGAKAASPLEIPVTNIPDRQTYYGTIDLTTKRCFIQPYDFNPMTKGNSDSTIAFLQYLMQQ